MKQDVAATADELGGVLRDYVDAAQRLQQTHEVLRGEVTRLREELASKDQELERRRRLAAIGELAAGVAHEVRNPLGAIQLYSGLLRNACGGYAPALELIDKIERGIQAIDRVVHDTLALAPSHAAFGACLLRELVERAAEVCRPTFEHAGVTLRTHLADPQLRLRANEDGLRRVLINLLVNAADAAPPGSEVELTAAAGVDGWVELRISDRGPGLPDEVLERLFTPFFTTKAHGTGLGLSIAYRLVEAHGGRLSAGNRDGGGAEFVIFLPSSADGQHRASAESNAFELAARRTSAA